MAYIISHLPDTIIVDDEITLRAKTRDDFDEFVEIASANRDHLFRWLPWAIEIPNEGSLEHYRDSPQRKKDNKEANWNVTFENKLVGAIGVLVRGITGEDLEIGYWLAAEYTGKGIITRSVKKLVDTIFTNTDAEYIEIGCNPENTNSKNVALRSNFEFHAQLEKHPGLEHDEPCLIYRITKKKWQLAQ